MLGPRRGARSHVHGEGGGTNQTESVGRQRGTRLQQSIVIRDLYATRDYESPYHERLLSHDLVARGWRSGRALRQPLPFGNNEGLGGRG